MCEIARLEAEENRYRNRIKRKKMKKIPFLRSTNTPILTFFSLSRGENEWNWGGSSPLGGPWRVEARARVCSQKNRDVSWRGRWSRQAGRVSGLSGQWGPFLLYTPPFDDSYFVLIVPSPRPAYGSPLFHHLSLSLLLWQDKQVQAFYRPCREYLLRRREARNVLHVGYCEEFGYA